MQKNIYTEKYIPIKNRQVDRQREGDREREIERESGRERKGEKKGKNNMRCRLKVKVMRGKTAGRNQKYFGREK